MKEKQEGTERNRKRRYKLLWGEFLIWPIFIKILSNARDKSSSPRAIENITYFEPKLLVSYQIPNLKIGLPVAAKATHRARKHTLYCVLNLYT
jgi:hypothetical protein